MPAISLTAYRRSLDQLAELIRTETDAGKRSKLVNDFRLLCAESRRLRAEHELTSRDIQAE
jgi:hypothetical protein